MKKRDGFVIGFSVITIFLFVLVYPYRIHAYLNGMPADLVIWQASFTANSRDQGGSAGAATIDDPKGLVVVGTKLIVADEGNNRVLIFNFLPTVNNQSADVVIGQASFSGSLANRGGAVAANTLNQPYDVTTDGTKLFITDSGNNRILIYNSLPAVNGASADV